MRNCRSRAAKLSTLVFGLALLVGGTAGAVEERVESVPSGDGYVVIAALVPGNGAGEVSGRGGDGSHVDFRVSFGTDGALLANGQALGTYEPTVTYYVRIECWRDGVNSYATTRVTRAATGEPVAEQIAFAVAGNATHVRAVGAETSVLTVN